MMWFQLGPAALQVWSNPGGEQVVAGGVSFDRAGSTLTVNQGSDRVIINWQDFSIGQGEVTKFIQPSATSAALNRVISQNVSEIYGTLEANGQIYLVNPNGLTIGSSGVINVQSFIASTHDVSNEEFLAGGDMTFRQIDNRQSTIVNLGTISADGGDIILIANRTENAGKLSAPDGTVGLAAGTDVLLKASGEERIFIQSAVGCGQSAVENSGLIEAASAELKAAGGNEYALAINNAGVIRATGVEKVGGRVFLRGAGSKIRNAGSIVGLAEIEAKTVELDAASADVALGKNTASYANNEDLSFTDVDQIVIEQVGDGTELQGTSADDLINVTFIDEDTIAYAFEGGTEVTLDGLNRFSIQGGDGDDWVNFDASAGGELLANGIDYDGNGPATLPGDGMSVMGDGIDDSLTYAPDAETYGEGVFLFNGGEIRFRNLEPIDISGMANVSLTLPGADDILTIAEGVDFTTGTQDALRVSGTSGGVAIETVAFFNNTTVTIDTSAISDGNDTLAITGASNAHGNANLIFTTGAGSDSIVISGDMTTSGSQTFNGAVILGDNIIFSGVNLTFNGTIDSSSGNLFSLTANDSGTTTFTDSIGLTDRLFGLTTDAAGTTSLSFVNGNSVESIQTQDGEVVFNDDVVLTKSVLFNTRGDVTFNGKVDGGHTIAARIQGTTTFNDAVGSVTPISSFQHLAAGYNTIFNGGSITSTFILSFTELNLASDTVMTAGNFVRFRNTVDGNYNLTVNTTQDVQIWDVFGGTNSLASLTLNPTSGISLEKSASVTTTGIQTYNGEVFLDTDVTLTGTGIAFNNAIDSSSGNQFSLTVNDSGTTTFTGAVGGTDALSSLMVNAATGIAVQNDITTSGNQTYMGNFIIDGSIALITNAGGTDAGNVDLSGATIFGTTAGDDLTIDVRSLSANAAGNVLLGSVGNGGTGEYLQDLQILSTNSVFDDAERGVLVLNGDVMLDDDGAGNASSFAFTGGNVVLANSVTIDTEQGNTAGVNGGSVDFGDAVLSADALGRDFLVDTSTTRSVTAGNITLGSVTNADPDSLGGQYVNEFELDAYQQNGGTDGVIRTGSQISTQASGAAFDSGHVTISGNWQLDSSVNIATNNGTASIQFGIGTVDLRFATVSATTTDVDLSLDLFFPTSDNINLNGGLTRFGEFDASGGNQLRNITIDASPGGTVAEGGDLQMHGAVEISGTFDVLVGDVFFNNASGSSRNEISSLTAGDVDVRATLRQGGQTADIEMQDSGGAANTFITSTTGHINLEAEGVIQLMLIDSAADLMATTGGSILLGDDVTSAGTQSYSNQVQLLADVILDGTGITFDDKVDSSSGTNFNLMVNDSGITTFAGSVGAIDALAGLTTDTGGTTQIHGGMVRTTGNQIYRNALVVNQATTLASTTGDIKIHKGIASSDADTDLTVLAVGDILVNGSIQYAGNGDVVLVAGWDGTTTDLTGFLSDNSIYGNNTGSVVIGDGTQATGIAVGSRDGNTYLGAYDLTMTAGSVDSAYTHLGYRIDTSTSGGTATGDIGVALNHDFVGTSGSNYDTYVQIGHGGHDVDDSPVDSENATLSGNITIHRVNDFTFTNSGYSALYDGSYTQLGHGGVRTSGNYSGDIVITQANDITVNGGTTAAYGQIGHGGYQASGTHSGDITITSANNITFVGTTEYVQLGHGGLDARGTKSGNISIISANDIRFQSSGFQGYAQLGNGGLFGFNSFDTASGDITVNAAGDLDLIGSSLLQGYAQIGHGNGPSSTAGANVSGDIDITVGGETSLVNGSGSQSIWFIGHLNGPSGPIANANISLTAGSLDYTTGSTSTSVTFNQDFADRFGANLVGGDVTVSATGANGNDGDLVNSGTWGYSSANTLTLESNDSLTNDAQITNSGAGDIVLVSDQMILNTALASGGGLAIKPFNADTDIGVGNGAAGTLLVDAADLALFSGNFAFVTIGDTASGTGDVDVQAATLGTNTTISGETIAVNGTVEAGANDVFFLVGPASAGTMHLDNPVNTTGSFVIEGSSSSNFADIFNISNVTSRLIIRGRGGMDTVNLGNASNSLDDITARVTFRGNGNNSDTLNINDQGDSGSVTYDFGTDQITRSEGGSSVLIDWNSSTEIINLNGGSNAVANVGTSGDDIFTFVDLNTFLFGGVNVTVSGIDGLGGTDTADFSGVTGALEYTLNLTGLISNNGGTNLFNVEILTGGTGDDSLTVDFSGGNPVPAGGFTFNGGGQTTATGDNIAITGGSFTTATFNYLVSSNAANGNDGIIDLDGTLITYTGLEPIDMTGSTATDFIFNLPSGDDKATLRDDGGAGDNVNELASTSTVPTFETTLFTTPSGSVTINTSAGGTDTVLINGLDSLFNADLSVMGDRDDTVEVTADTNINGGAFFAEAMDVMVGFDLSTSGNAKIQLQAFRNLLIDNAATISTVNGKIRLFGNKDGSFSGDFDGVEILNDSTVTSVNGNITIKGRGGDTGDGNEGVEIEDDVVVETTGTGNIAIVGHGGGDDTGNNSSEGVQISNATVRVADGDLSITGTGSKFGDNNEGVEIQDGALVSSSGTGTITINGTGRGKGDNQGVQIEDSGTQVTSILGNILITGTSEGKKDVNEGISIEDDAVVSSTGTGVNAATITLNGTGSDKGTEARAGVVIQGDAQVTSIDGAINITGQGGNGIKDNSRGIVLFDGGTVDSTGTGANAATITLMGTGGTGDNDNMGVSIDLDSFVRTVDGAIMITGQGGAGTGEDNFGVAVFDGSWVQSTGLGGITIMGTAGDGGTQDLMGVLLEGGEFAAGVSGTDGDIMITGLAADGSSEFNIGVSLDVGGVVESTGNGRITIMGTGGSGVDFNYGIGITDKASDGTFSHIRSVSGAIDLTGTGGAFSQSENHGIYLRSGGFIESTGSGPSAATITLDGTGGAGNSVNAGVVLESDSLITSVDGAINITAHGGAGSGFGQVGFVLFNGASVSATGTASVNIVGTGGSGTEYLDGVLLAGLLSDVMISSATGDITITGVAGAGTLGTDLDIGVEMFGSDVNSSDGSATITGTAGGGNSPALLGNSGARFNIANCLVFESKDGDISIDDQVLADQLLVLGTSADAAELTRNGNDVNVLAANVGSLLFEDTDGFTVDTVKLVNGITTSLTAGINLEARSGTMQINQSLTANNAGEILLRVGRNSAGQVDLNAGQTTTGDFTIKGGDNNDIFNLRVVSSVLKVLGNGGDDTFNVGNLTNSLDEIAANLDLRGKDGTADTLNINDQGDTDANIYDIGDNARIKRINGATVTINYTNTMEIINLNGSTSSEDVLRGTGTDDTFTLLTPDSGIFSNPNLLRDVNWTGINRFNGQGSGDNDTVDYSALAGPVTFRFNDTAKNIETLTGSGSGADSFEGRAGGETFNFNGGTFVVGSLTVTGFENVDARGGKDTFNFNTGIFSGNIMGGGNADTFNFLGGSVTGDVKGQNGDDVFFVDLDAYASAPITINNINGNGQDKADKLQLQGAGPITIDGVAQTVSDGNATVGFAMGIESLCVQSSGRALVSTMLNLGGLLEIQAAGDVIWNASITADGVQIQGNTLFMNGDVTSTGSGINLIANTSFQNSGFSLNPASRFLVYSVDPFDDTLGGLTGSVEFGILFPDLPAFSGNGFVYSTRLSDTIASQALLLNQKLQNALAQLLYDGFDEQTISDLIAFLNTEEGRRLLYESGTNEQALQNIILWLSSFDVAANGL